MALVFFEAAFIRLDYHLNSRIAAVVRISHPGKCKHEKVREWDTQDTRTGHKDTRTQGWNAYKDGIHKDTTLVTGTI